VSDDLVAFLRARLDEDEQAARAVHVPPDWHQGPGDDPEWASDEMVLWWPPEFHTPYEQDKHWRGLTVNTPELAAYLARHDPARVLAEVDAKRRLLKMHTTRRRTFTPGKPIVEGVTCPICYRADGACSTLRVLALPYAQHPDYRPEWAPGV
jgi:hypothetical protein